MATSDSGLRDSIDVALNPEPADAPPSETGYVPDRPADGAPKDKWVTYCVALGADEHFLTNDTEHVVEVDRDNNAVTTTESALSRNELIDLADRLGG